MKVREILAITLCIMQDFIRKAELLSQLWNSRLIIGIRSNRVGDEAEEL